MNFCLRAAVVRYDRKATALPVRPTPRYRGLGACGCPTLRKHSTNTPTHQNEWLLTLLSSPVFPMTSYAPVSARTRSRWTFCCYHHRHGIMTIFLHYRHQITYILDHCLPLSLALSSQRPQCPPSRRSSPLSRAHYLQHPLLTVAWDGADRSGHVNDLSPVLIV